MPVILCAYCQYTTSESPDLITAWGRALDHERENCEGLEFVKEKEKVRALLDDLDEWLYEMADTVGKLRKELE